jgi:predicted RND superfamily exporter protein
MEMVLDDLTRFPPLIMLAMTLLLWLLLRSLVAALVPLATVFISVVWTVGTITAMGYSLNILTALIPPLLMILSLSYSMYVVSEFRLSARGERAGEVEAAEILRKVSLPVMLAGLTTARGIRNNCHFDLYSLVARAVATLVETDGEPWAPAQRHQI